MSEEHKQQYGGIALVYEGDNDKEIMLCLRAPDMEHYASHWSIPSGYHEEGETTKETAIRELKEETMIDIPSCEYVGTLHETFHVYKYVTATKLKPILDREHTSWDYFKKDELPIVIEGELKNLIKSKIL
mgnify:CR=1 FL=1|tara:strand:+ start:98 stop:487 length:390 start_codon:yes stop_codon:yes gene_type:complete